MSEQTGNIYQKLAKVRKQVEVIRKNKSGYGYKYVTEDEILAKISVFMDKYHLSLVPSIQSGTTRVEPYTYKKTKTTGKGEFYQSFRRLSVSFLSEAHPAYPRQRNVFRKLWHIHAQAD